MQSKKQSANIAKFHDFVDVKIEEDTILQPDALIVCSPIHKKFLDFLATLVIEILSDATALKDRHTKFSLYQNFSSEKTFIFLLSDDCKIDVVFKNIWE